MKAFKALITASIVASALFTGCADKKNSSSDVDIALDLRDLNAEMTDLEIEYNAYTRYMNNYLYETPENINSATVELPNGKILIEHSGDNQSGFSLIYRIFADTQETIEEIQPHIDAKSEIKDNELIMKLVEADTGEDMDTWLEANYPDCRILYDVYVSVPTYVTDYRAVCNGIGEIEFADLAGSFTADLEAGNITFSDNEITGDTFVKCGTGNIAMNANTYKGNTDIKAETGNITFCLPLNGSDGADISVAADTGNIEVTGIKNYEKKGEKKEGSSHSLDINVENCNIGFSVGTGNLKIDKE